MLLSLSIAARNAAGRNRIDRNCPLSCATPGTSPTRTATAMDLYEGSSIIKSRSEVGHLKNGGGELFTATMYFRNTMLTDRLLCFLCRFRRRTFHG
jgi:hypothetical protein